ncbi:TetR family transcriptional regulator, partial [Streptomyces varsoviensis]
MVPRSASVNEELRRRSRERFLQATVELVGERGYEATTLAHIADRAGAARGLVSYYFPGKRQLLQSAVHRLMHLELAAGLEREPRTEDGRELLARAIDAILGLARDHPLLMRTHMAGILQAEGFIQCPEQQRLATLLRDTVVSYGSADPDTDY